MRNTVSGETGVRDAALDTAILEKLNKTRSSIDARSLLVWGEHCTECAMPSCFANCSLYTPRADLKCRRFENGIEALRAKPTTATAVRLMRVKFRKWGKLEAVGGSEIAPMGRSDFIEHLDQGVSGLLDSIPLRYSWRRSAMRKWDRLTSLVSRYVARNQEATSFVVEAICTEPVNLTLTIRPTDRAEAKFFQRRLELISGHNVISIASEEIFAHVERAGNFLIQIENAEDESEPEVTFGVIGFVDAKPNSSKDVTSPTNSAAESIKVEDSTPVSPKVKCVVWDLDNTIWSGTLIENGLENLKLNEDAAAAIIELDRRGILQSIASKNSAEDAELALRHFGLWDYFLSPQIHWHPKSASISAIAKALNIGKDTFLFVDDQAFERHEVRYFHDDVEVMDAADIGSLLSQPRLDVPITVESARRRLMYREEESRESALRESAADFAAFLKTCDIRLTIEKLQAENLKRAFELTERTNQLNYAGRRLSFAELDRLSSSTEPKIGLVLAAQDRFGNYGIIGFCILDREPWEIESFFMSCRVQRKKVEQAFFSYLCEIGARFGKQELAIRYKKTQRNDPSREVLEDEMKLRSKDGWDGERLFLLTASEKTSDNDIVAIEDRSGLASMQPLELTNAGPD
jgi:FkbH-like protein